MKAFFIITRTNEMHKHIESFTCLPGNEAKHFMFEHRQTGGLPSEQALDAHVMKEATSYAPDIIVYVGACQGRMPSATMFRELRTRVAPTVAFISDAGDKPWWSKVLEYDREKSFAVQVALDGGGEWPQADHHLAALTPLDPSYFPTPIKPHAERSMFFGYTGNPGAAQRKGVAIGRLLFTDKMKQLGLHHRNRMQSFCDLERDAKTYADAAKFMSDIRLMPNFSHTGSYERHHVKGRVVEAGWAGSMLLEMKAAPTRQWFTLGEDFLEYETMEDVEKILAHFKARPEESQAFGERLRKKVEAEHSPEKFWERILERVGVKVPA